MHQQQPQQVLSNGKGAARLAPPVANFPPPYRSPPHPAVLKQHQQHQQQIQGAYSKFNLSEPNIMNFMGSPIGYRHTINNESSQQMQHGLRNMLNTSHDGQQTRNHNTLDNKTHHSPAGHRQPQQQQQQQQQQMLHNMQRKLPLPGDTYVSPENLRDAANKMFSRNQHERSSLGGMNHNGMYPTNNNKMATEEAKRQSFANNSFRQATGQQQELTKTPPTVPPKPNSASREKLKEDIDQELKHILAPMGNGTYVNTRQQRYSLSNQMNGNTPPLPALSPELISPDSSPSQQKSAVPQHLQMHPKNNNSNNKNTDSMKRNQLKVGMRKYQDEMTTQLTQSAMAGSGLTADLESVLGLQTDITSEESLDMGDAVAIRQQLDGLENMYSEVLKLLGLKKYGRAPAGQSGLDGKRRKMYGSMSSLPSVSSIGSRSHLYNRDRNSRGNTKRGGSVSTGKDKSNNKRFQRLESHVVTLARSVAHLTSEMRNQQLLIQEVESLRLEIQQMKGTTGPANAPPQRFLQQGYMDPENFFAAANNTTSAARVNNVQANRVRKLTKFFGDEPPLLRLFLKNLGYEKYAALFEEAKIGLLELPYLSDERLDKLGVPVGPRIRILQEAKVSIANEPNYNVYIL